MLQLYMTMGRVRQSKTCLRNSGRWTRSVGRWCRAIGEHEGRPIRRTRSEDQYKAVPRSVVSLRSRVPVLVAGQSTARTRTGTTRTRSALARGVPQRRSHVTTPINDQGGYIETPCRLSSISDRTGTACSPEVAGAGITLRACAHGRRPVRCN